MVSAVEPARLIKGNAPALETRIKHEEDFEMGMMAYPQWDGFHGGQWQRTVDVRSFIQKNVTP